MNGDQRYWKVYLSNSTSLFAENHEIENKQKFVYPNPSSNRIILSGFKYSEEYQIVNVSGQKIQQGICKNGKPINIENLSNGVYYILLNNSSAIKFIKE
jgi:hypothetical protein